MAKYYDLKKILLKNGFEYQRNSKGSHERWINTQSGMFTTLTKHSKDISKTVERSIIKAIKQSNKILGGSNE